MSDEGFLQRRIEAQSERIEALKAVLLVAAGELAKGTVDQRDTALKITRIAALAPEQDKQ